MLCKHMQGKGKEGGGYSEKISMHDVVLSEEVLLQKMFKVIKKTE